MAVLFANFASSTLAAGITSTSLVLALRAGDGKKFPLPSAGNYFMVVVEDAEGNAEIMQCTGRNTDLLTVVRAQEGTVRDDFIAGSRVENRVTAGVLANIATNNQIRPTDDIIMQDANLAIQSTYYESVNPDATIRGANRIAIPSFGKPFIGLSSANPVERIMTTSDIPLGVILLWSGFLTNIPDRWRLCDGRTYFGVESPDLRNFFIMGAGDDTDDDIIAKPHRKKTSRGTRTAGFGSHDHGGKTGDHKLADDEMPGHRHSVTVTTTLENGVEVESKPMLRIYDYPLYAVRQPPSDPNYRPFNPHEPGGPGGEVGGGLGGGSQGTSTSSTTGRTSYAGGSSTTVDTLADEHSHTISDDGGHSGGLEIEDVTPAYYALAYIIKVS